MRLLFSLKLLSTHLKTLCNKQAPPLLFDSSKLNQLNQMALPSTFSSCPVTQMPTLPCGSIAGKNKPSSPLHSRMYSHMSMPNTTSLSQALPFAPAISLGKQPIRAPVPIRRWVWGATCAPRRATALLPQVSPRKHSIGKRNPAPTACRASGCLNHVPSTLPDSATRRHLSGRGGGGLTPPWFLAFIPSLRERGRGGQFGV